MEPLTPDSCIEILHAHGDFLRFNREPDKTRAILTEFAQCGPLTLDVERLNILLLLWGVGPAAGGFLQYYFGGAIRYRQQLEAGLARFVRDALWHFGSVNRGFNGLRQHRDIESLLAQSHYDVEAMKTRLPWTLIRNIPSNERGLLGYVSGQKPFDEERDTELAGAVLDVLEKERHTIEALTEAEVAELVYGRMATSHRSVREAIERVLELDGLHDLNLFAASELEQNRLRLEDKRNAINKVIERVRELRSVGEENLAHYLRNIESIDVYVATSMRNDEEYNEMTEFVQAAFGSDRLTDLNLRYFDPTLAYCESRIDKGIIEGLLVHAADVTVYCAQGMDTFGKDSELAATLCLGKPVIVYVPRPDDPVLRAKADKRAEVFKEFHPLGLQLGIADGVARGVIVVRSAAECAEILYQLFTNALQTEIKQEEHGLVLREKLTGSVLRVATGWETLRNVFWHCYGRGRTRTLRVANVDNVFARQLGT